MPQRDTDYRLLEPLLALLVAAAVLLLAATVMWQLPGGSGGTVQPAPAQLRWLPFAAPVPPAGPVVSPPEPLPSAAPLSSPVPARPSPPMVVARAATTAASSPATVPPAATLFDGQGRPRLAVDGSAGLDRRSQAERVFDHSADPLATRRDDGLFDTPRAGTAQSRSQRLIYGEDVQAVRARPPPPVPYNPARHERRSDLASAHGPEAYRLASIAEQPPPGLGGQASGQLLPRQAALEPSLRCGLPAMADARAALSSHLALLQQAEQRYRHGSSPIEREHSLQAEIGRQYNLARRALWQAERLSAQCPQG